MRHNEVVPAGWLFRGIILSLIERETDPAERKARIMIAYEHGHLTAAEVDDWLAVDGLEAA